MGIGCRSAVPLAGDSCALPGLGETPPLMTGAAMLETEYIPVPDALRQPYNHTASIVVEPDGTLLVAWGAGAFELARDTAIWMARRPAGGEWEMPVVIADRADHADGNGVLFHDSTGLLHLYYVEMFGATFCEGQVLERTSADGGRAWSEPRKLLPTICVMTRNKPVIMPCGRWLLPTYLQGVYASWFWMSDDAGVTWQSSDSLFTLPNNLQPAIALRSDGSTLALMRRAGEGSFTWEGTSDDGGVSWRLTPREDLLNSNSGLDLLRLRNGMFVLAYDDSDVARSPLVVRASLDEGATWLPPRVIARSEVQVSYPSVAEGPDGWIHVVYSEDLKRIGHVTFEPAWLLP